MGAASNFIRKNVAAGAGFLVWPTGDSRLRRYPSGVSDGFMRALYRRAGGCRGVMCGINLESQGTWHDGIPDCGRRVIASGANYLGYTTGQPAGVIGIPMMGPADVTTTLNGAINSAVTTVVVADVNSAQWPAGTGQQIYIRIDDEIIYTDTRSTVTLSSCSRGVLGTKAASHSNGATVSLYCYNAGTNNGSAHWRQNQSAWIPSGETFDIFNAGIQLTSLSPVGINGDLKYLVGFENADAVDTTRTVQLYWQPVVAGGASVTAATTGSATVGTAFKMCPGGTVGAMGIGSLALAAASRADTGLVAAIGSAQGPCLFNWQAAVNTGISGGVMLAVDASCAGRKLSDWIASHLRTTNAFAGLVKAFQFYRSSCSSAHGGSGNARLVHLIAFMANDITDTQRAFVTAGQSWTVELSAACGTNDATTTSFSVAANSFPSAGHGYITGTGERISWTGGGGTTTLTGVTRNDFTQASGGTVGTGSSTTSANTLQVGYVSATPTGYASNVYWKIAQINAAWDASDVSAQNATYPLISSGSQVAIRADVTAPNSANDCLHLIERFPPTSDTRTDGGAGAISIPTTAQREYRNDEYVNAVRMKVALPNVEVQDLAEVVTAAQGLARGYWDDPADPIHQSQLGFTEPQEAWWESRVSTATSNGDIGGGGRGSTSTRFFGFSPL